jgi:DNA (cytosine-5)-methyltransferase 1
VSPLVIDLFAGGGGASEGIRRALGRCPDVAVNHDEHAIRMHALNHPNTIHLREDVFDVDPWTTCRGRRPDLLWASPDCTHFSRAKGDVPRSKKIRGLAWVVADWARAVQPRVILVENVPEFLTWGPLDETGRPDKAAAGEHFREWLQHLTLAGYRVEWRALRACDYGAPTIRNRLYIIARSDGEPIVWPEPTHGPGRPLPWRTAAECIDWTIPCPSIFARKKPLADATQRRIAEGLRRFVLESPRPFIAPLRGTSTAHRSVHPVDGPLSTITGQGQHHALVVPSVLNLSHGGRQEDIAEPMRTITATPKGGDRALLTAWLSNTRNGERAGQAPRVRSVEEPAWTITANGSQGAVVSAWLAKHYTGVVGSGLDQPIGTVTARDHHSLVEAHLGHGGRAREVAAFLVQYYGSGGQWAKLTEPMRTIVTKARMGLVEVVIDGSPWAVTDIGLRMLTPRELATAQGLQRDYVLQGTTEQQIARIGNMVCPDVVEALVRAQVGRAGRAAA